MAKVEKTFKVSRDESMNPELKKEIQDLRSLIWENLPNLENPRFQMAQDNDKPGVWIQDCETGKIIRVSLCNMHGAIQILNAFFPKP